MLKGFFRLGVSHKIFSIGGIGISGFLLIGGIYYFGVVSVDRYQKISDAAGGSGALPNKVFVGLLEIRRSEKDFLLRSDEKYAKHHGEQVTAVRKDLQAMTQQFDSQGHAELTKLSKALATGLDGYAKNFKAVADAKIALGLNENSGLEGALRNSVHAIETVLKTVDNAPAMVAMLMMRRHEKDFMLRRNEKYGAEMTKAAGNFSTIIEKSDLAPDLKQDIAKKLADYQRDFSAYMAGMKGVLAQQKSLSDAYAVMEPQVVALVKGADKLAASARNNADEARAETAQEMMIALIAVSIVVAFLAFFVARGIIQPIKGLVGELQKLAGGSFNVSLPWGKRHDEIGEITRAVGIVVEKVGSTVSGIKTAAADVTNASAEISTSTSDLSQRTEEQAASLEETSASMEEISATVKKNAENAQQASQSATATQRVANHGSEIVTKAVGAMAKIENSSRKISDIIGVIDEIARQTNLLALNAAVEAARAGEAGRGFAVVATEVRSLAQRSSQAAKDITLLITDSTGQVKDGVDLVNKAGEALNQIVESIKTTVSVVNDIANASSEQASGIEQINKALNQMDEATQQNSALVEENAATAKLLENQAKAMDQQVAFFQVGGTTEHATAARAADEPQVDDAETAPPEAALAAA
jgi:methyl-accepting chemotaxis protein